MLIKNSFLFYKEENNYKKSREDEFQDYYMEGTLQEYANPINVALK